MFTVAILGLVLVLAILVGLRKMCLTDAIQIGVTQVNEREITLRGLTDILLGEYGAQINGLTE